MTTEQSESNAQTVTDNRLPSIALLGSVVPIITQADIDQCLGSGELLRCPFCGERAMSTGRRTENGRAICWKVQCEGRGIIPDCTASVWATHPNQDIAREKAVARWNRRLPNDKDQGHGGNVAQ